MPETGPGIRTPNSEAIDWVEGSAPDLNEREQMLVRNAHREGYSEGHAQGYTEGHAAGGVEAIQSMTTLVTHVSARDFFHALKTLAYFVRAEEADL